MTFLAVFAGLCLVASVATCIYTQCILRKTYEIIDFFFPDGEFFIVEDEPEHDSN